MQPRPAPWASSTAALCEEMRLIAARFGFAPIQGREFAEARALARDLMQHEVADVDTFMAVQALQPAASICLKEAGRIIGVLGMLWLRAPAVTQILAGRFDAVSLDPELLSRGGETPAAGYGWGVAAATKPAGKAALACGDAFTSGPFARFDIFSRVVTPVGRHIALTRSGCVPLRSPDDDLVFRPALINVKRVA
jgi:hypothetical protein